MSTSRLNYREGDTNEVYVAYDASHPIEKGDLVFKDASSGYARTASNMANQGSAALNQLAFAQDFIGVAMQKAGLQTNEKSFRLITDPKPPCVRVATTGLFEFACDSETEDVGVGGMVGIYATSSQISDSQKVMAADTGSSLTRSRTIGFLRPQPASFAQTDPDQTRCLVEIDAAYAKGGVGTVSSVAGTYTGASGQ